MEENGLGKSSNYVPKINAGTNGSKKKKKEAKEILDADLKKAAEKKAREEKAAAAAAAQMQYENRRDNTGGYQSSFGKDTGFMEGSGTSKDMGSFNRGGLATMFTRRR